MYKYLLAFIILVQYKRVQSDINIDVLTNSDGHLSVNYTGIEVSAISDSDVQLFRIDTLHLKDACEKHFGRKPSSVFLKSPTPWGDLFKSYKWEEIKKVISIKSARLKKDTKSSVTISSQKFENLSDKPIKVNAGITRTVENTISSTWTETNETESTMALELNVNFITGNIGFSNTFTYGKEEERSESVTIGTTTGVEIELKPGQSVTAVLTANVGNIEVEVIYRTKLRGNLAVNFKRAHKGHHFWGPAIGDVMVSGGMNNEVTTKQAVKCGYYADASLKVLDNMTGKPV